MLSVSDCFREADISNRAPDRKLWAEVKHEMCETGETGGEGPSCTSNPQ